VVAISSYVGSVIAVVVGVTIVSTRHVIGHVFSHDPEVWALTSHIAILMGIAYVAVSAFYVSFSVLQGQSRNQVVAIGE
jgi:Na+-driven multidrug efflux pump